MMKIFKTILVFEQSLKYEINKKKIFFKLYTI